MLQEEATTRREMCSTFLWCVTAAAGGVSLYKFHQYRYLADLIEIVNDRPVLTPCDLIARGGLASFHVPKGPCWEKHENHEREGRWMPVRRVRLGREFRCKRRGRRARGDVGPRGRGLRVLVRRGCSDGGLPGAGLRLLRDFKWKRTGRPAGGLPSRREGKEKKHGRRSRPSKRRGSEQPRMLNRSESSGSSVSILTVRTRTAEVAILPLGGGLERRDRIAAGGGLGGRRPCTFRAWLARIAPRGEVFRGVVGLAGWVSAWHGNRRGGTEGDS